MKQTTKLGIALMALWTVIGTVETVSVSYGQSGPMGPGMHHGRMMHGADLWHGPWRHVQMHGLPRDTSTMSFEARGRYVYETACVGCHGVQGRGGIDNPNYVLDTVPALDGLAGAMGLLRKEDSQAVLKLLAQGVDLGSRQTSPPFPTYQRFVGQYQAVRNTIEHGRQATKKNPSGLPPQNMPAWKGALNDRDIDAVIGYIIRLQDYPEPGRRQNSHTQLDIAAP